MEPKVFQKGQRVKIVNLNQFSAEEFGYTEKDFLDLLNIADSEDAFIVSEETDGYWNVRFEFIDCKINALSDYHIEEVN